MKGIVCQTQRIFFLHFHPNNVLLRTLALKVLIFVKPKGISRRDNAKSAPHGCSVLKCKCQVQCEYLNSV